MKKLKVTGTPDEFEFNFIDDFDEPEADRLDHIIKTIILKRDEVRVLDGLIKLLYTTGVLNENPVLTSINMEMDIDKVMKQAADITAQMKQQQGIPVEETEESEQAGHYV